MEIPRFNLTHICGPLELCDCFSMYPFLKIFDQDDDGQISTALMQVFNATISHSRIQRSIPVPMAGLPDIFVTKMIDYALVYSIMQVKGYLIRTVILSLVYIFVFPFLNILFIKTGLLSALVNISLDDNMEPIQPPNENSDVMQILAWQVYHAMNAMANIDQNKFIFG